MRKALLWLVHYRFGWQMTGVTLTGASLTVFQLDGWWWVVKCDVYDVSRLGGGAAVTCAANHCWLAAAQRDQCLIVTVLHRL